MAGEPQNGEGAGLRRTGNSRRAGTQSKLSRHEAADGRLVEGHEQLGDRAENIQASTASTA